MFTDHPRRLGADGLPARDSVSDLLLRTLPGRALVVGAAIRLLAWLAQLVVGRTPLTDAIGTVGTLALLAGITIFAARLIALARRRLLWRVRRKLILSFIFVGLVPALLIIVFFALCGVLLFSSISSYVVETRLRGLAEQAQFLAQTTAIELARAGPLADLAERLERKQAALESRFPEASMALVPVSRTCASDAPGVPVARDLQAPLAVGTWPHVDAPTSVPAWVGCGGFSGLMAYWVDPPASEPRTRGPEAPGTGNTEAGTGSGAPTGGHVRLFVRAVAFPTSPAPPYAVVLDVPLNELTAVRLREETGISLRAVTLMSGTAMLPMPGRSRTRPPESPAPDTIVRSALQPTWVVFLEFTDWVTGRTGTATLSIVLNVGEIYARLSPRVGNRGLTFGQLLVAIIVLVGVLFLIIQFVALLMGLALARSITGSVHELFVGTERVRQGDFSHRIAVLAKDQLGELADSFNSMTSHLSSLLAEMAEKKRLEEELRIARRIQMSLLPQNPPVEFPGVSLTAVCQPAREVGGDYYDFLPLEGNRLGLLIADVAGKGTSAALYMAELKGLMLSLTLVHRSPRDLLVSANRIISAHLDSRSFITMTYAVLDLDARTMTWARAGHTPLIHLPHGGDRVAQILVPDGMVLGLRIDNGERFEAALEEVTIPLTGGDLFMFFTDGLSEQMNHAEDLFGEPRLGTIIEQHGALPCDELRERILREVHAFADGAPQHDDMTFILLRVDDVPARAGDRSPDQQAVLA
jgi:serine phosphatase RsbU (regulator of sigma subunit)